jgi:hypothetical protein
MSLNSAELWWRFWTFAFVAAGTGFAVIAVIVLFKGVGDLKEMLRLLTARAKR